MELGMMQKQVQTLSPLMMQSMEILQMGTQELREYVEKTVQENPVLDAEERTGEAGERFRELGRQLEWLESNDRQNVFYYRQDDEDAPLREYGVAENWEETLYGHLISQIQGMELSASERKAVTFLAESLNGSGWLDEPMETLAQAAGCEMDMMERGLEILQRLDPAGVGARNLSECLVLQLRRADPGDTLAVRIAQGCLEPLARSQYSLIAKKLGAELCAVRKACGRIRELNPRPGAGFAGREAPSYITPDVVVVWEHDHFEVVADDQALPTLTLSGYYSRLFRECKEAEVQSYLCDKVRQAKWVIRSIEQRRSTLLECARCIVELQEAFFRKGPGHLAPMSLADVAERVGVHESTVSRAVREKYLQCDKGVYPLGYFFSRRLGEGNDGASPDAAKAIIRRLIEGEDGRAPLSDQKLCERMAEEGCVISRRTVAKYREELGIPSTTGRKCYE